MASCQYNYNSSLYPKYHFSCNEEARTGSFFCIFHDENYVKNHYEEFEHEATKRFEEKIRESYSENKPLECIGFHLPPIKFELYFPIITFMKESFSQPIYFTQPVYFNRAIFYTGNFSLTKFSNEANFSEAIFSDTANFYGAKFSNKASFSYSKFSDEANFQAAEFSRAYFNETKFSDEASFIGAKFSDYANFIGAIFSDTANFYRAEFSHIVNFLNTKFSDYANFSDAIFSNEANFHGATFSDYASFSETIFSSNDSGIYFNYVLFEQPNKVSFDKNDLSKVSFAGSDITRIRFGDNVSWGKDGFTIVEEEWLREQTKKREKGKEEGKEEEELFSLDLFLSVYRNLRENYEFRLRYDEAGKFFIKEMELKRKYRSVRLKNGKYFEVKKNNWFRRNISLTGLYYHFSSYGESILRPTVIGIITIGLSTLFWLTQSDPTLHPSFSENNPSSSNISNFIWVSKFNDTNHLLRSFERSFADFIPLLPMGTEIKVGIIDYIIKIVGGALTFGLLAIALRRKFERKYTR